MYVRSTVIYKHLVCVFFPAAPDDFQRITMTTLTFSAAVLQQNVTLHIRDDPLYEGRENFSLVLRTSDSRVVPSPDQVSILITDNDSEINGEYGC